MKTILITGATDGIGLEATKLMVAQGHRVLVHGRNPAKLADVAQLLSTLPGAGPVETYRADLSDLSRAEALAAEVAAAHRSLDILINNAGVLKVPGGSPAEGLDVRFVVNTLVPVLLARRLRPLMGMGSRVVSLSSAAQAPVVETVMTGERPASDLDTYSQSKLALTAWSRLQAERDPSGPVMIALNPGSLLGTNMVRDGFGMAGKDMSVGAEIIVKAALDPGFDNASGQYFDNDAGRFAPPHPDVMHAAKATAIQELINAHLPGDA